MPDSDEEHKYVLEVNRRPGLHDGTSENLPDPTVTDSPNSKRIENETCSDITDEEVELTTKKFISRKNTTRSRVKSKRKKAAIPATNEVADYVKEHLNLSMNDAKDNAQPTQNFDIASSDEDEIEKKKVTRKSSDDSQLSNISPRCILFISALGILVGVILFCLTSSYWIPTKMKLTKHNYLQKKLDEKLSDLETYFPNQKTYAKMLRVAIKSIFGEPKQPTVIILFASPGAEHATSCFARNLARTIELVMDRNRKNYIHLKGHHLQNRIASDDTIKEILEKEAYAGFTNGSHVYLLENFNLLPSGSVMMFHGLCDDNFAPFKKVVYLFTVDLLDYGIKNSNEFNESNLKKFDVTKIWSKEIHEDNLMSLESRIGAFKVLVTPDDYWKRFKRILNC